MTQASNTIPPPPSQSQSLGEMLFELLTAQVQQIPEAHSAKEAARIEGQLRAIATAARGGLHVRSLLGELDEGPAPSVEALERRREAVSGRLAQMIEEARERVDRRRGAWREELTVKVEMEGDRATDAEASIASAFPLEGGRAGDGGGGG